MKKVLILAAVAALSLASCSKNVVIPNTSDQNAISFSVYADRALQTRGLVTDAEAADATSTTILTDGFLMNAVLYTDGETVPTTANFMANQPVYYDADATPKWYYSPAKYWPTVETQKINFYAWGPVNVTGAATSGTNVDELSFTLQTGPSAMVDLVAANAIGLNSGSVDLNFKHVLSRLNFSAITSDDLAANGTYIVVKKATILASTGEASSPVASEIYSGGTYKFDAATNGKGSWTPGAAIAANIVLDQNNIWSNAGEASVGTGTTVYTNTGQLPIVASNTTATKLFKDNQYLFFVPVNGTTGTTGDRTYIEFEYDIITLDANMGGYAESSAVKSIALPSGILQQGIAYNICFQFSVNKITIGNVTMDPWTNAAGESDKEEGKTV